MGAEKASVTAGRRAAIARLAAPLALLLAPPARAYGGRADIERVQRGENPRYEALKKDIEASGQGNIQEISGFDGVD